MKSNSNEAVTKQLRIGHEPIGDTQNTLNEMNLARESARKLFARKAQGITIDIPCLIDLGLLLINHDPNLGAYRFILHQEENPAAKMREWILLDKFDDLINEDITGEFIAPSDIAIPLEKNKKISGLALMQTYLSRLNNNALNKIGLEIIPTLDVPYVDSHGKRTVLKVIDTLNKDLFDKKLSKYLDQTPAPTYVSVCIEEFLKPLSALVDNYNESIKNNPKFISFTMSNWDQAIKLEMNACATKKAILRLILRYTQLASSNRAVDGRGGAESDIESTYKLQSLVFHFWIDILNHSDRVILIQNKNFRSYFEIVSCDGTLFSPSYKSLYTTYLGTSRNGVTCLDRAQSLLSEVINSIQFEGGKPLSGWGFGSQRVKKQQSPDQLRAFAAMLAEAELGEALKYGCKVRIDKKGRYELVSLRKSAILNQKKALSWLLNCYPTVTNECLYSLNNEKISSKVINLLIKKNNYWLEKYGTLEHLIEGCVASKIEPPHIVLQYFYEQRFRHQTLNQKNYAKITQNSPAISESSIFYYETMKALVDNQKKTTKGANFTARFLAFFKHADKKQKTETNVTKPIESTRASVPAMS
ncbi:MAG: hypothetical protein H2069_07330 [Legionella sp.]|nr:hypothetical protein [Legionella sp.]